MNVEWLSVAKKLAGSRLIYFLGGRSTRAEQSECLVNSLESLLFCVSRLKTKFLFLKEFESDVILIKKLQ